MTQNDWDLYSSYIYCLLNCANDPTQLPPKYMNAMPHSENQMSLFVADCGILGRIDTTLAITNTALAKAGSDFTDVKDLAARLANAQPPSQDEITTMIGELNAVNQYIQNDQKVAAIVKVIGSAISAAGSRLKTK
jgi:hypothetical protein